MNIRADRVTAFRSSTGRPFVVFPACLAIAALTLLLASCATPPPEIPKPQPAPVAPPPPEPPKKPLPPAAPVRPVAETFFGETVTDPYRYLEETGSPEVDAFMKAQAEFSRKALDALPGRASLRQRIEALSQAGVTITGVQVVGDGKKPQVFYYRLGPGDAHRKLHVREGFTGNERLLFDPASISGPDQRFALNHFVASPDGRHVIVGVAAGGSEQTVLRIIDVPTARDNGVAIDRVAFPEATHWMTDGRSFFYNRLPAETGLAVKNRYLNSRAFRHVLGRATEKDEAVFGAGVDSSIAFADVDIPSIEPNSDGKYLIGKIQHGDLKDISLFVAPATGGNGLPDWRRAAAPRDEVTAFAAHNNALYLLTHKDAPRYKVVRTGLQRPDLERATSVVPHGDTVISQLAIAQDALYIRELFGGTDRLQRLNFSQTVFSGGKLEFVRLPFDLAIKEMITDPKWPGALLRLEGWTEAPRYVNIEERSGNLADTRLQPKSDIDFSHIDEVRLMVTAKDGTKVPVSLIYKKGTTLDASRPTLLRAYGAYGLAQTAAFSPATLAWLERGGVIGTCHVRGGGEFGEAWHLAGQKLSKPNTWRDLIACAEYLIERKFTRKEKLAIVGGSAGGITVGRALTERPDLFAAVVSQVGVLDALRFEFTPNGPPNIAEFGSVTTADGFKGLRAMSALHHVSDGTQYPGVLLVHGVNDPRVEVWQSVKMAARLQAAVAGQPDANPVLLRLDYDAGHGIGSARAQRNGELADIYAFLLWQFGDPAFQPPPLPMPPSSPVPAPAPAPPK